MLKLGITLGDPAGVGPELLVKSLPILSQTRAHFLIFGDENLIEELSQAYQIPLPQNLTLLNLSKIKPTPGKPTPESHLASIRYLEGALEALKSGEIKGVITLPINKEAFEVAGLPFRGHTEFLAKNLKAKKYAMSFYGKKLKVSLVTTHLPLKEVPSAIKEERILEIASLSYDFLQKLKGGKREIKMALCALNPHAGEGGLLGSEEKEVLQGALVKAQGLGIPLYGPFPADSLFYFALQGHFDYVLALYHDQGLIPFKMLHFKDGVNVTLGLPVVRTSPVHGVAYDLAGKGLAHTGSFVSAVKLALKLAKKW